MTGKKILFISGIQLSPPQSGGQLRSLNICKALANNGNNVKVYSLTGRKKNYLRIRSSFHLVHNKNLNERVNMSFIFGLLQFVSYRLSLPPLWLSIILKFFMPPTLRTEIKKCDLIILDFPFLYPLIDKTTKKTILNTHNIEYELYPGRKLIQWIVKKIELNALKKAQTVIFCCDRDKNNFGRYAHKIPTSLILPNGLDIEEYKTSENLKRQAREQLCIKESDWIVLFTGSRYRPNREAFFFLKRWCHDHQSELKKHNITFFIAGSVANTNESFPHFKVVGMVEEMSPYFQASNVAINPVEQGSGSNVKMLEYIAFQLPIISTEFGCRGLNLKQGKDVLILNKEKLLYQILALKKKNHTQKLNLMSQNAYNKNELILDMNKAIQIVPLG